MAHEAPLVTMDNLHFSRSDRVIFDGITLQVPRHSITGIMGPSGTGKTTLLRMIGSQLRPDSGTIRMDGVDMTTLKRKPLFALRRKMGFLFQSGALFTDMTVFDNVAFPLRVHTSLNARMIRDIVLMKLQAVGLRCASALMPNELSGGMARRVALARAIALDPMLIMYDEPFVGQDPITKGILVQLIRQLNDALALTSIVVSHDVDEVMAICDYVYIINEGRVLAHGKPEQLSNPEQAMPQVTQFLQGAPDGPIPFHYSGHHGDASLQRYPL